MTMLWENEPQAYRHKIADIVAALRTKDLPKAKTSISETIALHMDAPEPQNLLGILYELLGDYQSARKHYRAAYALDPTYKPCCRNLERITSFDFSIKISDIDFGVTEDSAQETHTKSKTDRE
jgi:Flp pilus assembly protein TadD